MKILIDMNLSPAWAAALSQAGFESVHWSEVGAADAPDETICDYAHRLSLRGRGRGDRLDNNWKTNDANTIHTYQQTDG